MSMSCCITQLLLSFSCHPDIILYTWAKKVYLTSLSIFSCWSALSCLIIQYVGVHFKYVIYTYSSQSIQPWFNIKCGGTAVSSSVVSSGSSKPDWRTQMLAPIIPSRLWLLLWGCFSSHLVSVLCFQSLLSFKWSTSKLICSSTLH